MKTVEEINAQIKDLKEEIAKYEIEKEKYTSELVIDILNRDIEANKQRIAALDWVLV